MTFGNVVNSLPITAWKLKGRGGKLLVTERREKLKTQTQTTVKKV